MWNPLTGRSSDIPPKVSTILLGFLSLYHSRRPHSVPLTNTEKPIS